MSEKHLPMPVTRRATAACASLLVLANAMFVGASGGLWSKVVYAVLGLLAVFPVDYLPGLWRLLTDRRPVAADYGTAAALDPREGHVETPDLHLIGRVLERRKL
jgi:hypothetical protein